MRGRLRAFLRRSYRGDRSATCCFAQQDTEQIDLPVVRTGSFEVSDNLTLRVRLKSITPDKPTPIEWRYGGEGQGGQVIHGVLAKAGVPTDAPLEAHALAVGQWSAPVPIVSLAQRFPEKFFLTITAGNPAKTVDRATDRRGGHSTNVTFEFEFRTGSDVIKTFTSQGPDGGTTTLVIP